MYSIYSLHFSFATQLRFGKCRWKFFLLQLLQRHGHSGHEHPNDHPYLVQHLLQRHHHHHHRLLCLPTVPHRSNSTRHPLSLHSALLCEHQSSAQADRCCEALSHLLALPRDHCWCCDHSFLREGPQLHPEIRQCSFSFWNFLFFEIKP